MPASSHNSQPPLTSDIVLCQCFECSANECVHPRTSLLVAGRLVPQSVLKQHLRLANIREITSANIAASLAIDSAPCHVLPASSSLGHGQDAGSSRTRKEVTLRSIRSSYPSFYPTNCRYPFTVTQRKKILQTAAPSRDGNVLKMVLPSLLSTLANMDRLFTISPKFFSYRNIIFQTPPTPSSPPLKGNDTGDLLELDSTKSIPANFQAAAYRDDLYRSLDFLLNVDRDHGQFSTELRLRSRDLQQRIKRELLDMNRSLRSEWERQRWLVTEAGDCYVSTAHYTNFPFLDFAPKMLAWYLFVAVLHILCEVSAAQCQFALNFYRYAEENFSAPATPQLSNMQPPDYPTDVRTVVDLLNLEHPSSPFVSCPRCHCLYPYDLDVSTLNSNLPTHCTYKAHPDNPPCGRRLLKIQSRKGAADKVVPTRTFLYHRMADWVGWMYSRPDIEEYFDQDPVERSPTEGGIVDDIWQAEELRTFLGPDRKTPFYQRQGSEGRLIFSLNMDGFNPYTSKAAGKVVTVGGLYMVCLNLPPAIRYKVENMYLVGIIPGPKAPSKHQLNSVLKPLVDDLVKFWELGFFLSRTAHFPQGRWVRCAVIPLVCDLAAARQMSGLGHHSSSNICSVCYMKLDDIRNIDPTQWRRRSDSEHRFFASFWLHASTEAERDTSVAPLVGS